MNFLGLGRVQRDRNGGASAVPPGDRVGSSDLRLESAYLAKALPLSLDAPGAHAVTLLVDGWLEQEAARARLVADPNVCDVNDFGDRSACTRLAPRTYAVALTRLRAADPACAGRRLFAITGAGLPDGLTLVLYPQGDRAYLKLGDEIVPLHDQDSAWC